ncbi:F-box protein [Senna tora]|uniref:F-box protein n=1 Tax=Senna tora TaxID=362788 RepID=A0A834W0F0_9FABA|nr:F-box protein [Senna tora]
MENRPETFLPLPLNILDLPVHLLSDILLKLPVFSIFSCRCVCKTFLKILSNSYFSHLYISRAPTSFVVVTDQLRLFYLDCYGQALASDYASSCQAAVQKPSSSLTYRSGIDCHNITDHHQIQTDAFQDKFTSRNVYYICNPILGEFLRVPPPPSSAREYLGSAFGYDPETKVYKILQFVWRSNRVIAELYKLGDNSWTVIENNVSSAKPKGSFDPSLNGALHWVTDSSKNSELICSFDLRTDEFKPVLPPAHLDVEFVKKISWINVGVLEDCLCLCYISEGAVFEAWLMKEYGIKESWTQKFTIDIKSYCGLRLEDKHRPIGFTSYGDMWLKCDSDSYCLVSYGPKRGSFKVIDVGGISSKFEATPHILSFVSLRDVVNVRDTHLYFEIIRPSKN